MEEALAAMRRAMADEEVGEMTLAPTEPRSSHEEPGTKRVADAGLLSREATAAVGSAFNTLTETVKKQEPTLEDVVRETLRPIAQVMAGRKLDQRGRANGTGRDRTGHSRTLTSPPPDGGQIKLITRNGYHFADRYPPIVDAVASLPADSCIIDGEAIVVDQSGFGLLRYRRMTTPRLCVSSTSLNSMVRTYG